MEPKIVTREAFTVVGLLYHGKAQEGEIPQLWRALGAREHEIRDVVSYRVSYGLSANMDKETGEFDYLAAFEAKAGEDIPEGMVAWRVPGGTYAAFGCTLPTIADVFHHAHGTWMPQSGYVCGDGPEFEVYGEQFDETDPESVFEVYFPIRKP